MQREPICKLYSCRPSLFRASSTRRVRRHDGVFAPAKIRRKAEHGSAACFASHSRHAPTIRHRLDRRERAELIALLTGGAKFELLLPGLDYPLMGALRRQLRVEGRRRGRGVQAGRHLPAELVVQVGVVRAGCLNRCVAVASLTVIDICRYSAGRSAFGSLRRTAWMVTACPAVPQGPSAGARARTGDPIRATWDESPNGVGAGTRRGWSSL